MTNLTATPGWDSVPQIETTTPLLGGAGGPLNNPAQALLNRTEKLRTERALRAASITGFDSTGLLDGAVIVFSGRDAANDGGGGAFTFSSGSTQAADGGCVFAPTGGGRLFREGWTVVGFNGPVNVRWFGAKSDWNGATGTDDTAAIQAALNAYARVYFPGNCRVTADLTTNQPYAELSGDGLYTNTGITRTGAGAGTILTFGAPTLYAKMRGVHAKWIPATGTDYYNTGSVGVDVTSSNTSIDMDEVYLKGCEKNVKGNYNGYYNKFFRCRFEESRYPIFGFSINNLNVIMCRFKGFNDALTVNGSGGPLNVMFTWFEVFNGAIISSTGVEKGVVNFHNNYVEIYDGEPLPTNFPQSAQAHVGKFGGNVLFAGPFGTLSIRNNEMGLGGAYIMSSLSACDVYESSGNNIKVYTANGSLRRLHSLPVVKRCIVQDRLGDAVGADGGYTGGLAVTYDQDTQVPALANPYCEFSFYDPILDKNLYSPTQVYAPALLNGWVSGSAADGVPTIIYEKNGLFLQGVVTGTASTGIVIFNLPANKRPPVKSTNRSFCFLATASDEGSGVTVQLRYLYATGDFRLENAPTSKVNIILDGLFIPAQV